MTVDDVVRLPWAWREPRLVEEDGQAHLEMRIDDLPEFFVAGATEEEVRAEAEPALRAYLASYLENGEVPPLPRNFAVAWNLHIPYQAGGAVAGGEWIRLGNPTRMEETSVKDDDREPVAA